MIAESTEVDSYRIVEFCGERNKKGQKVLEIVAVKWMHQEDENAKRGVCYFPPENEYENLEKLLRSHTNPKKTWEKFDVEILTSAGNYEKAQRRLKRLYKKHSDVESNTSDCDETQQIIISKKRAARMLKKYTSLRPIAEAKEDESDSAVMNTSSQFNMCTAVQPRADPETTISTGRSQGLPQTKVERKLELQKQMQSLRDKGKNDPLKVFFMNYLDVKSELLVVQLQDHIQNMRRAQQYDLNNKTEDLKESLSCLSSQNSTDPSATTQLGVVIPITTLEDFEMFEEMLDPKAERNIATPDSALEKQEILKRVMKILAQGTQKWEKTVNAILLGLIKKDVQQHYSGLGRKVHGVGKRNFSATLSFSCMKDVVEQIYEGKPEKLNILSATSSFLALWRDREGGCAERRRAARKGPTTATFSRLRTHSLSGLCFEIFKLKSGGEGLENVVTQSTVASHSRKK
ncbi:uncharacterized protein LOC135171217 [Diachasmimorpha longicaudata]|uniref:uncharacterized protein LOC135171217 n=1 Tax=Diachasmimorpha longicaudata TaxID=58733 RepID=UPI0030B8DCA7